ncbi:MAG: hypothetical protein ABIQ31_25860 [Ferruginibacter sp.]
MTTKQILYAINKIILFACVSMYFGTGWSLILFSFPTAHELTPANYYSHFVPQVTAATDFFRGMTMVMIFCCVALIIEEWKTRLKWFGVGVLLTVILATALTIIYILPYNRSMAAGIATLEELTLVLNKWMRLNLIRVIAWTIQWLLMMFYFLTLLNRKPIKTTIDVS